LIDKVLEGFERDEQAVIFIESMMALKPRYTRDQMSMVARFQDRPVMTASVLLRKSINAKK